MTSDPVDANTEILTLTEVNMPSQSEDALAVLGVEAKELVDDLEGAKIKSDTGDQEVVIKAEKTENEQPQDAEGEDTPDDNTETTVKSMITRLVEVLPQAVDARIKSLGLTDLSEKLTNIESQLEALKASEAAKVKAAIDNKDGDWLVELVTKNFQSKSVQHRNDAVVKGDQVQSGSPAVSKSAGLDSDYWALLGCDPNKSEVGGER